MGNFRDATQEAEMTRMRRQALEAQAMPPPMAPAALLPDASGRARTRDRAVPIPAAAPNQLIQEDTTSQRRRSRPPADIVIRDTVAAPFRLTKCRQC
jgi:hypothetical protein